MMDLVSDILVDELLGAKGGAQVGSAFGCYIDLCALKEIPCIGQMLVLGYEPGFCGIGMVAKRRSEGS